MLSVGIVGPIGPGPLNRNPISIDTEYNEDSPPRNVKISIDAGTHVMLITWQNNCPMSTHNPIYIITLTELTFNTTAMVELTHLAKNHTMEHKFLGIKDGAVFNVSVSSPGKTAIPVVQKVYAPALPSPRQLKVYPEKNGTYVVYWKEIADQK